MDGIETVEEAAKLSMLPQVSPFHHSYLYGFLRGVIRHVANGEMTGKEGLRLLVEEEEKCRYSPEAARGETNTLED